METKRVVVLGAGFAGLHAVRALSGKPGVEVVLVDRNNHHLFQPLLYQVATAGLEAPQIAFPIRAFLRRRNNVRFLMGNAEGVEPRERVLWVEGQPVPYDYLVVGTGSRTHDFGLPGVAEYGLGLKSLDDAMKIRDRILSACEEAVRTSDPERRRALLTFVVAGGGPTGVELAGALGELRRHVIARDYPDLSPKEVRIVLIEAAPHLLSAFSPGSRAYAQGFLQSLGVELYLNERVVELTPGLVRLHSGRSIPSFTVIWSAGITGQALPGLPTTRGQRVATAPGLHLPDHPSIYVVGDLNYLEGPGGRPYPQVAPTAMQQGALAAKNILRSLRGEPPVAFRYKDKGSMATLGRSQAIAEMGPLKLRGSLAWGAWLAVHLYYLIGFRNRMMVLSNWAYSYFTYDFAVRIMHHRHVFPTPREAPIC
ncbi:NAD(P)/FAD-dependent oxidoreductase [Meiothermus sp. QL-1]|uniref:NAD(P)/FAD-dependent oxidoreductase n=1 Tax=Meiothermus sp. QL-1 TaxID=2058095 RepID=UPI000E09FC31|nr:NAD(P)/FAD-dependent oxidoreductase [Meiothermus sp. QL-1]RDI96066.1 NAD(P)/FAD-dependent oxidoreductase [Meiothermus sp. QL-1]